MFVFTFLIIRMKIWSNKGHAEKNKVMFCDVFYGNESRHKDGDWSDDNKSTDDDDDNDDDVYFFAMTSRCSWRSGSPTTGPNS